MTANSPENASSRTPISSRCVNSSARKTDHPLWDGCYSIETPEQVAYFEKLLGQKLDIKKFHYSFEASEVDWKPGDRKKIVHTVMAVNKSNPKRVESLHDIEKPDLPIIRKLLKRRLTILFMNVRLFPRRPLLTSKN